MFMKFFIFLLLIFFSVQITAERPLVFSPDFSGDTTIISAGTNLIPLCTHPNDPRCINQWSQQAVPLAVYSRGMGSLPQFQHFLPVFIPSRITGKNLQDDEDWEVFTPSFSYSSRSRSRKRSRRSERQESETEESQESKESDKEKPISEQVKGETLKTKQEVPDVSQKITIENKTPKEKDKPVVKDIKKPKVVAKKPKKKVSETFLKDKKAIQKLDETQETLKKPFKISDKKPPVLKTKKTKKDFTVKQIKPGTITADKTKQKKGDIKKI